MKQILSSQTFRMAISVSMALALVVMLFFGLQSIFHATQPFITTLKMKSTIPDQAFFYRH